MVVNYQKMLIFYMNSGHFFIQRTSGSRTRGNCMSRKHLLILRLETCSGYKILGLYSRNFQTKPNIKNSESLWQRIEVFCDSWPRPHSLRSFPVNLRIVLARVGALGYRDSRYRAVPGSVSI